MQALADYLADVAAVPFARGRADCCIFVADWVRGRTGIDPAEGLRGYTTDTGAMLRIGRAGGFLEMVRDAFTRHGFKQVQEPAIGDVAVLEAAREGGEPIYTMAIRATGTWAVKESDGLAFIVGKPVAIWRIG